MRETEEDVASQSDGDDIPDDSAALPQTPVPLKDHRADSG